MPRLIGIGGSRGLHVELGDHATLGRGAGCTIVLDDRLVSSRHAELRRERDGRYRLTDLGSTHGTHVGGARIREVVLRDGDELIVGASQFRFEQGPGPGAVVSFQADTPLIRHRLAVAARARFPRADPSLADPARREFERLRTASELGEDLARRVDLGDLSAALLARVFELVPAERAAVLLREPGAPRLVHRRAARRGGGDDGVTISTTILAEVIASRVGLVTVDATADVRFGEARSVLAGGIRSALAVPMIHADELYGIIHVDAPTAGVFDERDLEVMAEIATQAARATRDLALPFTAADVRAELDAAEPDPPPDRPELPPRLTAPFASGAAFLTAWDATTASVTVAADPPPPLGALVSLQIRFEAEEREFRAHGHVIDLRTGDAPAARVAIVPEEVSRRELILAAARGESVPYFRRNARRITLELRVQLTSENGVKLQGVTREVSARGMMLLTDPVLERGELVALRIAVASRSQPLRVGARVRSVVRDGAIRGVGLEFVFGSADEQRALAAVIDALAGRDP